MTRVTSTTTGPELASFLEISTLLEAWQGTSPHTRLERLAMLPLEERPQVLVCFDTPEPHTRVLWGTQYINPYFAQTTPEGGKVLAFEQEVRTGHLPATSDMDPYWIELEER